MEETQRAQKAKWNKKKNGFISHDELRVLFCDIYFEPSCKIQSTITGQLPT